MAGLYTCALDPTFGEASAPAMEFVLHLPRGPLGRFVEHIIYYAGAMPAHRREKLIPDGAIQIIVDLTEAPKRLYADERSPEGVDFRKAWISGMQRTFIVIEAQQQSSMLVVRFLPGGARAMLGHEADRYTDAVFSLEDVLDGAAISLRDRILEGEGATARIAAAEQWLMERRCSAIDPLIPYLARRLVQPGTRVGEVCAETGYTTRHVLDRFRRAVGVSPKQFARIGRFRHLLAILAEHGTSDPGTEANPLRRADWSGLAAELGYSDQSHLVNEFRGFAGITPAAYVAAYRGLENYLPIA